jgi:hypothetical protein
MAMRATTVRFSEDLWQRLESEAAAEGISAAQFVRDATLMRIGVLAGRRGDAETSLSLQAIAAGALSSRRARPQAPPGTDADSDPVATDPARLKALRATGLLDSPREEAFDRLVQLAARLLHAPVALVSLVEDNRQFFKSVIGLAEPWSTRRETPMSHSFCRHTLPSREPLVVEDARNHPLVHDNPAIRDLDVAAYAGVPLVTRSGHALGTLCVIDHQPRPWTTDQMETLKTLTASVMSEIELATARTAAA